MGALKFNFATTPSAGRPPYDPRIMLKLYLYGYFNRIRLSRRLEHETKRNVELLWLLEKQAPDFKTIADFKKNNKKAIKETFKDFVRLCKGWDLFGKETIAIDGTKFKASNSKKNNFSKKKLERHKKYIDEKIDRYLEELKNRKTSFENLEKELETSGQSEISIVDPDARLMNNNNNTVDVAYNVQTSVDHRHKLICDFKVTNEPKIKTLF